MMRHSPPVRGFCQKLKGPLLTVCRRLHCPAHTGQGGCLPGFRHIPFTEDARLDFLSFQAFPDPQGRNWLGAVLYRCVGAVRRTTTCPHNSARSPAPPVPPGATQCECKTRLRHKSLRDHRKPQKKDDLTLYEKFDRISQFASPTAAQCNPAGTSATPHFPHAHPSTPRTLPPRRESG
jgi:hypothetical protein